MKLFTIGTQGRKPEQVAEILFSADVELLVDVRACPSLPHDPCNSGRLSLALSIAGLAYWTERGLGVPSSVRKYAVGGSADARLRYVLDWYAARLEDRSPDMERAYMRVREALESSRAMALLCYEHDAATCHRSVLAEHLAKRHDLEIVNL